MLNHWGSGGAGRSLGGDDLLLGGDHAFHVDGLFQRNGPFDDRQADGAELVVLGRGGEPAYDFLAAQNLGAGSGSAPSKCSSTRRRGGRPMLCRRATVSWPR